MTTNPKLTDLTRDLDRLISDLDDASHTLSEIREDLSISWPTHPTEPQDPTVVFVESDNGPERQVCSAELHFHTGPLTGLKLVGFVLWRSPEGELYVTFPSRAFGAGSDRRFFDFVRSTDGTSIPSRRLKAWILSTYNMHLDNVLRTIGHDQEPK